jgi:hypothetical protein
MLERKRLYEPMDLVTAINGQVGIVLSETGYAKAKEALKESRRAGSFFAPGCCANPDYITQVPVLFEDGTYDVMRSRNIRKVKEVSQDKRSRLESLMRQLALEEVMR